MSYNKEEIKHYILTDGKEIFQHALFTELEIEKANKKAHDSTDGNLSWIEATEENKNMPDAF